ncbi:hypothetical protein ABDZ32_00200 [Aeromonas veronii]|uniref:hypothetical protein n=1 Tax=Aeromonas veronii TaxID=654 RepID=UPI0031FBCC35
MTQQKRQLFLMYLIPAHTGSVCPQLMAAFGLCQRPSQQGVASRLFLFLADKGR